VKTDARTKISKSSATLFLLLAFGPTLTHAANLTGRWDANDGGVYFLRQVGNQIYWYGRQNAIPPAWSNVFHGTFKGKTIEGRWADVPLGAHMGTGTLKLKLDACAEYMTATRQTGGFGGTKWSKTTNLNAPPLDRWAACDKINVQEDSVYAYPPGFFGKCPPNRRGEYQPNRR
jgi:hypothetical protein